MQVIYVGIDVAKDKFDLAISNRSIDEITYKTFNNNKDGFKEFNIYLRKMKIIKAIIGMEATGSYSINLADFLFNKKHTVYVLNPVKIKNFGKGSLYNIKTDKVDSEIILKFIIHNEDKLYTYKTPSKEEKLLKAYSLRRTELLTHKNQEINRLNSLSDGLSDIKRSHKRNIKFINDEIKKIEIKMKKLVEKNKIMSEIKERLTQVKGIGDITSYTMLSMVPELGLIKSKKVVALVGLAPYIKESGKQEWKRHTVRGRQHVKSILYMAAVSAIQHNKIMKEFYDRLILRGKQFKVAITAVMRKLLVIMNAIVRDYYKTLELQE